jgi:hypothetical protein
VSGYVQARAEGDAYDWRGGPRDRPHSLAVVGDGPTRGQVVTGPAVLARSVATNGVPVVRSP